MTYKLILTQFESLKDESKVCNFARDQSVFNRYEYNNYINLNIVHSNFVLRGDANVAP